MENNQIQEKEKNNATKTENKNNSTTTKTNSNVSKSEAKNNSNVEKNSSSNSGRKSSIEYLTLAEAYDRMLKGEVFRFKEWDDIKLPYVAFVKRGQTKIVIAKSVECNNVKPLRPSQEEAIKKLWYQVK